MKKYRYFILVMFLVVLGGCGPQSQFKKARSAEQNGRSYEAWQKYQNFAARYPTHALAPQAVFRAGWLAQLNLNDCFMANTFYDRVMERYPQADPWAQAARLQKLNCPDYFPLLPGSEWVEGDTETGGKIAQTKISSTKLTGEKKSFPSEKAILNFALFAGAKKVNEFRLIYKKKDGELHEYASLNNPASKIILKWPLELGSSWSTKSDKKIYRYSVAAEGLKIKVKAGEFENCIRVQSYAEGSAGGFKNDYYAPGVGRILKTVSTKNSESRITELISYSIAGWPDFEGDVTEGEKK